MTFALVKFRLTLIDENFTIFHKNKLKTEEENLKIILKHLFKSGIIYNLAEIILNFKLNSQNYFIILIHDYFLFRQNLL